MFFGWGEIKIYLPFASTQKIGIVAEKEKRATMSKRPEERTVGLSLWITVSEPHYKDSKDTTMIVFDGFDQTNRYDWEGERKKICDYVTSHKLDYLQHTRWWDDLKKNWPMEGEPPHGPDGIFSSTLDWVV